MSQPTEEQRKQWEEKLTKCAGKWVAIVDEHVVASGKDVALVVKEAKYPTKRPFLAKCLVKYINKYSFYNLFN